MEEKKKDNGPPLKILLADDTAVNVALATKLMKKRGHDITAVENGLEAYEAFQKDSFDVILMDITLNTSMTGIDAAREITKVSNIPIVFLTGNTDSSILDSGREISTNEVVAKTFDDEELHVAIQQSIISNAMNSEFKKNADK